MKQYKALMGVMLKNLFGFKSLQNRTKGTKIAVFVGGAFAALLVAAIVCIQVAFLVLGAGAQGYLTEIMHALTGAVQVIVLFFGSVAVLSYLFFSKDNSLLASLPIPPRTVFLAKFSIAYISQLFISAFLVLPLFTMVGIMSIVNGFGAVAWHFFLIQIASIFLLPIVPLALVSILSIPLMYLVSFFKKRALGKSILTAVMASLAVGFYVLIMVAMSGVGSEAEEGTMLSPAVVSVLAGIRGATVFNYHLVQAFMNVNAAANFFIYLACILGLLAVTVILSMLFYKKAMVTLLEGNATAHKSRALKIDESNSFMRSFLLKEFRTLITSTPLFAQVIIGIVLAPLMGFLVSFTGGFGIGGESPQMFSLAYITFLGFILISSTNVIATVGFSREGKHFYILKTLPVSARTLVQGKYIFAGIVTAIGTLLLAAVTPFALSIYNPVAIIGLLVVVFAGGLGTNAIGLKNDLKNPNLTWINASELVRNNKRQIKPALISTGIGFAYLIFGVMLAIFGSMNESLLYLIYFGGISVTIVPFALVGYKKLIESSDLGIYDGG
jgi:ABC-2 type transport system permease protein